jgi:hypothetical protein
MVISWSLLSTAKTPEKNCRAIGKTSQETGKQFGETRLKVTTEEKSRERPERWADQVSTKAFLRGSHTAKVMASIDDNQYRLVPRQHFRNSLAFYFFSLGLLSNMLPPARQLPPARFSFMSLFLVVSQNHAVL